MNKILLDPTREWLRDILSILIVFGIFYSLWIGAHPLFTPDEGRYSEVAREMVATGDYITPRLNGVAFLDKPALYYWLQATAIKIFGLSEAALRFWPALMGVLGSLYVYLIGRLLYSRRAGLLSACMLATSPLYYGAAHYANLDLEVAVLISNSLLSFIAATQMQGPRLKTGLFWLAYVFAGLAVLTKGLIGIAFPIMVVGAWILLLNRWRLLMNMRLVSGMVIFLAIAAPWYILVQHTNPKFMHFFFVTQQVSRFLTHQEFNDKAASWFYLPIVLAGFFPWSIFLIQSLAQKMKDVYLDKQLYARDLFLILWFFIVLIFFSIPKSKTVGYILPLFPVCALLVGSYVDKGWQNSNAKIFKSSLVIFMVMSISCGLAFITSSYFSAKLEIPQHFLPYLRDMGVVMLIMSMVSYYVYHGKSLKPFFISLLAMISILLLIFLCSATAINEKSIKPLALILKTQLKPNDEVITYYKYYQDLPIYLERRITIVADWHASDIEENDNWLREMWYGMVFQNTKDWLIEESTFWQRWHSGKRLFVITEKGYYEALKKQAKVFKISQFRNTVLFSNQPS
jgi:4-amino-4-deoxy-L-arabinose transferase-like glycosyltransferase